MILAAADEPIPVIHDGVRTYYGGDQEWFRKPWHRISGCGPTTAANMLAMAALKNPDLADLYKGNLERFNKAEFIRHMRRVRRFVVPGPFGLTSNDYFARAIGKYGRAAGCRLEPETAGGMTTVEAIKDYVRRMLQGGRSVAMLILIHKDAGFDDFTWHWMNITNYDENTGYISIATYGERYELDMERLIQGTDPLKNIKFVSM